MTRASHALPPSCSRASGGSAPVVRSLASLVLLATALAGCGGGKGTPDRGLTKIRVAGGDAATAATPFFAAMKQGFFRDAGLDVSYVTLAGGATSMDAAISSDAIDVGIGSATQWLSDAAKKAIKGKMIGEIADNNYVILGADGITDVRQLKGKLFGVSNYNAGDHLYARAVLSHYGIGADGVVWLAVGSPGGRLAALKAGKVAAIQMPLTNLPPAEAGRTIVRADASPFPFVSNAIFAQQAFLDSHRPALAKFLAAIGRGAVWVRAHPGGAVPACLESGADAAACRNAIAVALASKNPYTWSSTARLNIGAIATMIPVVAQVVPEARSLTMAEIADASLAREPS